MKKKPVIITCIVIVLISIVFMFSCQKKVSYFNSITGGLAIGTAQKLYIFISVVKIEKDCTPRMAYTLTPQFAYSTVRQQLYLIEIDADGEHRGIQLQCNEYLNYMYMHYLILEGRPIVAESFKSNKFFTIIGDTLTRVNSNNTHHSPIVKALYRRSLTSPGGQSDNIVEFNRKNGVIVESTLPQFSYSFSKPITIDWLKYKVVISCVKDNHLERSTITIRSPMLLESNITLEIPHDILKNIPHTKDEPKFSLFSYR